MSKIHRKKELGGFDGRIFSTVSGFGSVSSLQTKSDVLKTGWVRESVLKAVTA